MLKKLIEFAKRGVGEKQSQAVLIGRKAIDTYWTGNREITRDFSKEMIKDTAAMMMEEIVKTASSRDPRMANREKLANYVFTFAQFQVLVIDPPPALDPTRLRGQLGITGELKAHLFKLAENDKSLREFVHGLPVPLAQDDLWNAVLLRFRVLHAWAHVFHLLRAAFDDYNPAPGKDWFQPFVLAMCGWCEHGYRQCIGLPPSIEEGDLTIEEQALIMSGFRNCVLSGARYPDLEWNDRIRKVAIDKDNPLRTIASIGVLFFPELPNK
jgi:hypothetical protein